jgi:hypothetical protein
MAIASSVDAKNIKTYGPTQITGTLTLENADDLFVTTDDFILADQNFSSSLARILVVCSPNLRYFNFPSFSQR